MPIIYKSLKGDKHFAIRLLLGICFLIPMYMTKNLWIGERDFPKVPLFEGTMLTSSLFDFAIIIIFSVFIIGFMLKPTPFIGLTVVLIYSLLVILDQNRLQPFFFELIFAVLAMTLFSKNRKRVEQCLLLIFIGTYFWSGIHKANIYFFEKWMLGMSNRIGFVPEQLRALFTYSIPFLEASFGLMLLFKRTRKYGVLLIGIMHAIIVSTLLIEGFGYVVLPLTLFNVTTLFYLFYNSTFSFKELITITHKKTIAVFLLSIFFPVFNFFGFYDHLLSFSYFSGKPKYCRIWLTNSGDYEKLPDRYSKYMYEWEGKYYTDLNAWSQEAIGVGVYPEIRVYKQINKRIQEIIGNDKSTKMELY